MGQRGGGFLKYHTSLDAVAYKQDNIHGRRRGGVWSISCMTTVRDCLVGIVAMCNVIQIDKGVNFYPKNFRQGSQGEIYGAFHFPSLSICIFDRSRGGYNICGV